MTEENSIPSQDAVKEQVTEDNTQETTQGTPPKNVTVVPFIASHFSEPVTSDDAPSAQDDDATQDAPAPEATPEDVPEPESLPTPTIEGAPMIDSTDVAGATADDEHNESSPESDEDTEDNGEEDGDDSSLGSDTSSEEGKDGDDSSEDASSDENAPADEDEKSGDMNKVIVALKALRSMEANLKNVIALLESETGTVSAEKAADSVRDILRTSTKVDSRAHTNDGDSGRVVEGVFNGSNMVGSDGKIYTVPPNYASKSKLVEGDMLKLTITPKGSFIYKQIGPIERSRVVGSLGFDDTNGEWYATTDNRRWSVIKASVTYFRGDHGDEVVLLIPKNTPSRWAAVENIIKRDTLV